MWSSRTLQTCGPSSTAFPRQTNGALWSPQSKTLACGSFTINTTESTPGSNGSTNSSEPADAAGLRSNCTNDSRHKTFSTNQTSGDLEPHTPPRTRSPSSRHPPFTHYPFLLRSLVCGGKPSPHKPRLVVSHSTYPPLSSSPHAQLCITYCSNKHNNSEDIRNG
jgi:hypothetical protein